MQQNKCGHGVYKIDFCPLAFLAYAAFQDNVFENKNLDVVQIKLRLWKIVTNCKLCVLKNNLKRLILTFIQFMKTTWTNIMQSENAAGAARRTWVNKRRNILRRQSRNRNIHKVGVLPIRIEKSNVSNVGSPPERK